MNRNPSFPGAWFALLMTAAAVCLQVALSIPIEVVATLYSYATHQSLQHPTQHPLVLGAINVISFGAVVAWGVYMTQAPARQLFSFKWPNGWLMAGIVSAMLGAGIILSEADNLLRMVFPPPAWLVKLFLGLGGERGGVWSAALLFVVVAPATEELLFRGMILRGLLWHHRPWIAIGLSAGLFAAMHMNPWQMVSAASLGIIFGWWYWRTGSLWPSLIGHALFNAQSLGYRYLPVKIDGLNQGDPFEVTVLQPLWLDGCGLLLLTLGWSLFRCHSSKPAEATPLYSGPPPPVIPPANTAPA